MAWNQRGGGNWGHAATANDEVILKWVNNELKKRGVEVQNLGTDLRDGVLLINLCELLRPQEKMGRYFTTPANRIHKIENLHKVFSFCVRYGVKTVCCSSEDIVDGNPKLTRGLLYQMYHIFGDKNTEDYRKTFTMGKDFKYEDLVTLMEAEDAATAAAAATTAKAGDSATTTTSAPPTPTSITTPSEIPSANPTTRNTQSTFSPVRAMPSSAVRAQTPTLASVRAQALSRATPTPSSSSSSSNTTPATPNLSSSPSTFSTSTSSSTPTPTPIEEASFISLSTLIPPKESTTSSPSSSGLEQQSNISERECVGPVSPPSSQRKEEKQDISLEQSTTPPNSIALSTSAFTSDSKTTAEERKLIVVKVEGTLPSATERSPSPSPSSSSLAPNIYAYDSSCSTPSKPTPTLNSTIVTMETSSSSANEDVKKQELPPELPPPLGDLDSDDEDGFSDESYGKNRRKYKEEKGVREATAFSVYDMTFLREKLSIYEGEGKKSRISQVLRGIPETQTIEKLSSPPPPPPPSLLTGVIKKEQGQEPLQQDNNHHHQNNTADTSSLTALVSPRPTSPLSSPRYAAPHSVPSSFVTTISSNPITSSGSTNSFLVMRAVGMGAKGPSKGLLGSQRGKVLTPQTPSVETPTESASSSVPTPNYVSAFSAASIPPTATTASTALPSTPDVSTTPLASAPGTVATPTTSSILVSASSSPFLSNPTPSSEVISVGKVAVVSLVPRLDASCFPPLTSTTDSSSSLASVSPRKLQSPSLSPRTPLSPREQTVSPPLSPLGSAPTSPRPLPPLPPPPSSKLEKMIELDPAGPLKLSHLFDDLPSRISALVPATPLSVEKAFIPLSPSPSPTPAPSPSAPSPLCVDVHTTTNGIDDIPSSKVSPSPSPVMVGAVQLPAANSLLSPPTLRANGTPSTPGIQRPARPPRLQKLSPQTAAIRIQTKWRAYLFRRRIMKRVKQIRMRERVLKEILETEKEYVKRLVAIMKGYLEPMTIAHPKCGKALEEEKTFSCVNEIYMFHKLLMEDLSIRLAPPDSDETKPSNIGSKLIGDIFNRMAPFLKVYAMYCTNYEKTISTLQELRKKDSQFDSWLDERLEKPETGHLDLGMLMIAPVQRIPRYRLLLLDLIKNTWEDHEDYNYLCNASKLMEDVAEKVNESISVAERMNKVLSIKSKVTGIPEELVKPSRFFIQEGKSALCNVETQESHKCTLFLFNDALLVVERIALRGKYTHKHFVNLLDCETVFKDLPDLEVLRNCFQILTNGKTLTLKFKAEEDKRQWGDTLYSLLSSTNKPRDEVRPGRLNFSVLVTGTETRKNASKQEYTAYSININNRTTGFTCTIYKRYREFHSLNKQLRKKYPGHVFRNPLPHKQMLGNLSKETVESRRILLENYLQALLSDSEDFLKSPDFLAFLELNEAILANERARAFSRNTGSGGGGFGGATNHSTIITSSLYSPGSSRNLSATTATNIGGPTPLSGGNPVVGGGGGGGEASLFPAAPSSAQTLLSKVLLENVVPKKM